MFAVVEPERNRRIRTVAGFWESAALRTYLVQDVASPVAGCHQKAGQNQKFDRTKQQNQKTRTTEFAKPESEVRQTRIPF